MKKEAVPSFLALSAVSALLLAPGLAPNVGISFAQAAPAAPAAGQVQMDPKEYEAYDNAFNKQTTPQTQAPAIEAYLVAYPNSSVKADALQRLMIDYSQFDQAKTVTTADKVLQLDPGNMRANLMEAYVRNQQAVPMTDAAARQSGMDQAASYAQKTVSATRPTGMDDTSYNQVLAQMYSIIGTDALSKKDTATAIDAYKKELAATPIDQTTKAGTALQDTYYLGQAYYQSSTPDLVNCTFYATRAYSYAPAQFQSQMPLAAYCYKKYHGGSDGYDAVVTAAKANLNPPSDFSIKAAPTPEDQVKQILTTTSDADLAKLALSDKEFILQNGAAGDADKVFDTIKGKAVEIPGALVVAATADQLQVAVSDDAVQSKTADFTFSMKTPLTKVPEVGSKINLTGTYASYTQKPVMIAMADGEEVGAKKAAPARKPAPARRPR